MNHFFVNRIKINTHALQKETVNLAVKNIEKKNKLISNQSKK